jgi:hypothetical protein
MFRLRSKSAERLKRDGAGHRPILLEGKASPPETGGSAMAAPPPPIDQISSIAIRSVT